jgi:L-malate glycosyltransferase
MMTDYPNICVIGQMLGRNSGFITTQGQIAADLFRDDGYHVVSASSETNRVKRIVDIIATIFRNRRAIDVIIVEVYSGLSFGLADVSSLIAKYLGIPTIGVLHGGDLPRFRKQYPRWTSRVLSRFDRLAAPSGFLAAEFGAEELPVIMIPNVLDIGKYPYRERSQLRPILLWMRAFHSIYQPELALKVFSIVKARFPTARLVMAGTDKGLASVTEQMARELGLENSIEFPGFLDHRAKIEAFANADIFVNTTRIDNMPVAVVEACAMGLPVVATNVGGLPYLLKDGVNGFLVPDGDASSMADAIVRLLSEPELVRSFSENGRKLAEKSSWLLVKKQWASLFTEVLAVSRREAKSMSPPKFEGSSL